MTAITEADAGAIAEVARQELARRSLRDFCTRMDRKYEVAPHLALLINHLEALERRDIRRLIVAMPPRHGKSRLVSQLFPAWVTGRRPSESIILASYAAELATQNSRRVREIVSDERFPFDVRISTESFAANRWATEAGGIVLAVGVGSGATGFGADFLCIDDPIADRASAESPTIREQTWQWYTDVARTRLHPNAVQLVVATRWHEADLTGRLLDAMRDDWVVLSLPAICDDEDDALHRQIGEVLWPSKFPASELPSVEKGEISSRSFASLYQQRPLPAGGSMIKADWIRYFDELPAHQDMRIVWACDPASKTGSTNDFTALVKLGVTDSAFYVLDAIIGRYEFPQLLQIVTTLDADNPEAFYIEDTSNGIALIQTLQQETRLPVIACKVKGSKESRVDAITRLFEAGKVYFPSEAPWLVTMLEQLLHFPAWKNDDCVDALTLALERTAQPELWKRVRDIFYGPNRDDEAEPTEEELARDEAFRQRLSACGNHIGKRNAVIVEHEATEGACIS
jgi:predicted phage terminase large subunit-like protein